MNCQDCDIKPVQLRLMLLTAAGFKQGKVQSVALSAAEGFKVQNAKCKVQS
jgi:hypothetical protein